MGAGRGALAADLWVLAAGRGELAAACRLLCAGARRAGGSLCAGAFFAGVRVERELTNFKLVTNLVNRKMSRQKREE